MTLSSQDIVVRVQTEGKDLNDQFASEIEEFIEDTCIELTTSQEYYWLWETLTLTVPATATDWFDIDDQFHQVEEVAYADPNSSNNLRYFTYVNEKTYIRDYYNIVNDKLGRFRLRWNSSTNKFQMALVNGPAAGASILALVKKWLNGPEKFPNFMRETIVKGGLYRFLAMLEGDDMELAKFTQGEFIRLAKQQDKLGNNRMDHNPRRSKTNAELQRQHGENRYISS